MSVIGAPDEETVDRAWEASMKNILEVERELDIPAANEFQCGSYKMHSLEGAKIVAREVLEKGVGVMDNTMLKLNLE